MKHASKDLALTNRQTVKFGDAVQNHITSTTLRDHGGRAKVKMQWDLHELAKAHQVFLLSINGEKAYIDLEELLSYTRLV